MSEKAGGRIILPVVYAAAFTTGYFSGSSAGSGLLPASAMEVVWI